MSVNYKKGDNRVFYIVHTNKGKKAPFRIQQEQPRLNEAGKAITDSVSGNILTESKDTGIPFIPGVSREWSVPILSSGLFATGLNVEVANPYAELAYYRSTEFANVLQGRPLAKLQHVLEYEDNVDFNTYTDKFPHLDRNGVDMFPSVYKSKKVSIKLSNSVITLRMNNPMERLAYYALNYRHEEIEPVVAINLKEFDNPLVKEACKFVFLDENDKAEDMLESKKESREIGFLSTIIEDGIKNNLALQFMKALELQESRNLTFEKNPIQAANELINILEKSSDTRGKIRELYNLYNDTVGLAKFNAMVTIGDGLIYDHITKSPTGYTAYVVIDNQRTPQIYSDKESMIKNLFLNPKMKDVVKELTNVINNSKSQDTV